ncbi:MAG TPA: hypothetical protein VFR33_03510 [Candidatus Dormibacteraeota bacterium]|nr:hypothetical protein [Candidatus Dormibacteraeota bacterium]
MSDTPHDPGEDRLLPGEATSMKSGDVQDIRQWVAVYHELYSFKEKLLKELEEQTKCVTPPGGFELANDKHLLEAEASRLHRRLQFWEDRLGKGGGR